MKEVRLQNVVARHTGGRCHGRACFSSRSAAGGVHQDVFRASLVSFTTRVSEDVTLQGLAHGTNQQQFLITRPAVLYLFVRTASRDSRSLCTPPIRRVISDESVRPLLPSVHRERAPPAPHLSSRITRVATARNASLTSTRRWAENFPVCPAVACVRSALKRVTYSSIRQPDIPSATV